MPSLRDFLKKKDRIVENRPSSSNDANNAPEFSFIRSTTEAQEKIFIPDFPDDVPSTQVNRASTNNRNIEPVGFRNSANAAYTKDPTAKPESEPASEKASLDSPRKSKDEKRLSARLHLHRYSRSRSKSQETSTNLPENLPEVPASVTLPPGATQHGGAVEDLSVKEQREAQWEKRATMLAMSNPLLDASVGDGGGGGSGSGGRPESSRSRSPSISNAKGDVNIQEAIRLHESGELTESTHMFGQLASPKGENNALAQVLYGLALRHGWGVDIEPEKAIHYLSLAASNSASIEEQALTSGIQKGGAAKGELVLAIFELANCFRHGWGVKKDAIAARQYYETAANLGDTDAMEEAAWCYLEGFGGPKDKFKAAQYLRLAEKRGSKVVGNSCLADRV